MIYYILVVFKNRNYWVRLWGYGGKVIKNGWFFGGTGMGSFPILGCAQMVITSYGGDGWCVAWVAGGLCEVVLGF
jgi:hypothetical protein